MKNTTRIRVAALSTLLFLGGITAGGLGARAVNESTNASPGTMRPARTEVVRQTKVRTVHVKPRKRKAAGPPAGTSASQAAVAGAPAQAQLTVQRAPTRVQSRTSPAGGETGDHEGEHENGEHEDDEHEGVEHEGEDD